LGRKDCTVQNFHFHSRFTLLGHGDLDACLRGKALYIWNMAYIRSTLWDKRRRMKVIFVVLYVWLLLPHCGRSVRKQDCNTYVSGSLLLTLIRTVRHFYTWSPVCRVVRSVLFPRWYQSLSCAISHHVTTLCTSRSSLNLWPWRFCLISRNWWKLLDVNSCEGCS